MPGFPASDVSGDLKSIQSYDCEAAKALLAEAGYPDGEGFPALELKLRAESEVNAQRFIAAAASISECLNVEITINNMEFATYMDALLTRPTGIQFGAVSYGMDYLEPSNMLGVWVSTGRHSWRNAEFDRLVKEAAVFVGDPEERFQEVTFGIPGLGKFFVTSIFARDYPMIMGLVLLIAVFWGLTYLLTDVLYTIIDPRVRVAA